MIVIFLRNETTVRLLYIVMLQWYAIVSHA